MATPDLPENVFYCYALFDERGAPFYIGKGKGYRAFNHKYMPRSSRNRYRRNKLLKTIKTIGDCPVVMIRENISEREAFVLEAALIKAIGRFPNGPLVNMTDGGEGVSGRRHSAEARARIGASAKTRNTGRTPSEETRRKLSEAGRKHVVSQETRDKIGRAHKGRTYTDEALANIRHGSQNRGDAWRAKLSAVNRGKRLSDETTARISAGLRARANRLREAADSESSSPQLPFE